MPPNRPGPFGELLKRHRLAASYSQEMLADLAALSLRGVSDLERGARLAPRAETTRRLADALGLAGGERTAFFAAAKRNLPDAALDQEILTVPDNVSPIKLRVTHPHNLPALATPLLGREREMADLCALLRRDTVRLLTLTGPGGVGKTRLSIAVALAMVDAFCDGVWVVPLSNLTDPNLVVPEIAHVLGSHETGATPIAQVVRRHLREKHLLLVLDNFEHLVAAAPDVGDILAECPRVKALVTSRTHLRLSQHERTYPVQPLPLPDQAHLPMREQIMQYPGVALFVERAKTARADFAITSEAAPTIASICAHLDGLPLAIELAAARMNVLSPPALLKRLGRRLPLLTRAPRDAEARHQTMRHALAWSYALLRPAEQRLFRRLAIFAGGCTLEAAEVICAGPRGSEPQSAELLDGLDTLITHSLLLRRDEGDSVRFTMLHVIREYAHEQLEASGEAEELRQAHAAWFLAWAEQSRRGADYHPAQEPLWLDRLDVEWNNLRAALAWAVARERAAMAVQLAVAVGRYWYVRGYYRDGLYWFERIMALPALAALLPNAQAVAPAEPERSVPVSQSAQQDALALATATALNDGLRFPTELGRIVQYEHWVQASLTLSRQLGSGANEVRALMYHGFLALDQHRPPAEAHDYFQQALSCAQEIEHTGWIGACLSNLAAIARASGDFAAAEAYWKNALDLHRRSGLPGGIARQLISLAQLAADQGDFRRARALASESLAVIRTTKDPSMTAEILVVLALSLAEAGNALLGARLLGAAVAASETVGEALSDEDSGRIARATHRLRTILGETNWTAAFTQGTRLSLEEAMTLLHDERQSARATSRRLPRTRPR